jgi:hypothetical protein
MDGATLNPVAFRTPPRILIPKLVASRDGWKRKAGERKRRLKAARIRIRDLEASRDHWRERVIAAEHRAGEQRRQLEQELAAARAEADMLRDELKKKLPPLR